MEPDVLTDAFSGNDGIRAKALSAATHILATRGPDKLSLRAIAQAAGIGTTSIYHYFDNKDELLLSLAVKGFGDLQMHILRYQAKSRCASPMKASAWAYFDFAKTHPALFALMFNQRLMAQHDILREAERKAFSIYQRAVEADHRIPPHHSENAAHAIWALGLGILATLSSYPPGEDRAEMIRKLSDGASYLINRPD